MRCCGINHHQPKCLTLDRHLLSTDPLQELCYRPIADGAARCQASEERFLLAKSEGRVASFWSGFTPGRPTVHFWRKASSPKLVHYSHDASYHRFAPLPTPRLPLSHPPGRRAPAGRSGRDDLRPKWNSPSHLHPGPRSIGARSAALCPVRWSSTREGAWSFTRVWC